MEYTKEKRIEIENEYLALLINHNELINITQIRPEWLANPKARKMLRYALESYNDKLCFNVGYIAEKHKDFDFEYYIEVLDGFITYDSNVDKHLKTFEELIVKAYKEDIIKAYVRNSTEDRHKKRKFLRSVGVFMAKTLLLCL